MPALDLARPATDGDVVAGVPARLVAAPASTEEAAALLRAAAERGLAVVVRGGRSKLDWGTPPRRLDLIVDTGRLTGVVEHAAGDLIAVVRAGTPMSELQAALADQQLALDTPLPGATVGGTVATNTSGPRRMLYGTARDLLIGITVVRPDGKVAHAGGKVVKNVAGYDLGKLFTGSYGTLGLITECAFRLHPQPAAQAVVRTRVPNPANAVTAVLAAQVVPSAVEVDAPPGGGTEVAVLVEGSAAGVRDRAATLDKLLGGDTDEGVPQWWGAYPWQDGGTGVKLTAPLSRVPDLLAAASGVAVRGSAGTGVLYAGLAGDAAATVGTVERLRAAAVRAGGHAVVLTAPREVREIVDMWGPVPGLRLMRRVKDQFDPGHRFAPGRFVGGI
jgi:glycolate oxidase FAD binding subunit